MEKYDYRKTDKALYLPKTAPALVTVPPMRFFAVDGRGDPNAEGGEFARAMQLLYGMSFTVKMSPHGDHAIDGYYDYTVFPLEGLWERADGDYSALYEDKSQFVWTVMIRQPDFVTEDVYEWARAEMLRKKKTDASAVRLLVYDEGLCAQCMHIGAFDDEPATVRRLHAFMEENGLRTDWESGRRHHEIYLSDPRRAAEDKKKTVLRLPVRR